MGVCPERICRSDLYHLPRKELYLLPEGIVSFARSKLWHFPEVNCVIARRNEKMCNNVSLKMTICQYPRNTLNSIWQVIQINSLGQLIQSLREIDTLFHSFGQMTQLALGNRYNPFRQMKQIAFGKCAPGKWDMTVWTLPRIISTGN